MKEHLVPFIHLTEAQLTQLQNEAIINKAVKGTTIFRPDRINDRLLFLNKGLLRAYRLVEGKDYTHFFMTEGWFATDFQSFLTEQPSHLYIESLTPIEYFEFSKSGLYRLYELDQAFERLGRIIAEQAYLKMVERLIDFQTLPLKDRYVKLIGHKPELFRQVPQKMIASYLGVAEQSLSRIKSNWSSNS